MRTNVYIDGFNLYYGCLKGGPYKWLDLERLFDALLPRNDIRRLLYFTAQVEARPPDLDLPIRQQTYLRALRTLSRVEVHLGTFLTSTVKAPIVECDAAGQPLWHEGRPVIKRLPSGGVQLVRVLKTEEKGSDVNLACHLVRDAYRGDMDCAVVVSNDSDLLTPVRMVRADCGLKVGLVTPQAGQPGTPRFNRLPEGDPPAPACSCPAPTRHHGCGRLHQEAGGLDLRPCAPCPWAGGC